MLRTPYRDGTTHIVLEPLELMSRLAALSRDFDRVYAEGGPSSVPPGPIKDASILSANDCSWPNSAIGQRPLPQRVSHTIRLERQEGLLRDRDVSPLRVPGGIHAAP